MAAPEPEPILWQLLEWLGGVALIGCGWLWREISNKASKDDLTEAVRALKDQHATMLERVDEHYEDARESRDRLYDKVDEINKALGATMVSLSRLQGQLNRDDEHRRR